MSPKLPRENASVDEAVAEANKLLAIAMAAFAAAGAAAAAEKVGAIGCIDEDANATNMPLTERVAAGGE